MGSRINTFLRLSVFIANFDEYTDSLIDHLLDKKVGHWDIAVREITASALHNLTAVAPSRMLEKVLPKLLLAAESTADLFARHGAIVAVGFVISALAEKAITDQKTLKQLLGKRKV